MAFGTTDSHSQPWHCARAKVGLHYPAGVVKKGGAQATGPTNKNEVGQVSRTPPPDSFDRGACFVKKLPDLSNKLL